MNSNGRIEAVFFDIGSTLYHVEMEENPPWCLAVSEKLKNLGYNVNAEHVFNAYKSAREELKTLISPNELWHLSILSLALKKLNITPKPALVSEIYKVSVKSLSKSFKLNAEAKKTLKSLKNMGLKIGIISNASSYDVVYEALVKDGLEKYIDALITSQQISWKKPNPRIFFYACELLSVKPQKAVHVGDDPYADVLGSKKAGLISIQILTGKNKPSPYADYVVHNLSEILEIIKKL